MSSTEYPARYARWRGERRPPINRLAVDRFRNDPAAFARARAALAHSQAVHGMDHPRMREWAELMERGIEGVEAVLLEDSEHADDLRKAGPFASLLSNEESYAVLREREARKPKAGS